MGDIRIELENTIRIKATFKDFDDNLMDPDNARINIWNENFANKVTTASLTKESLGVWKGEIDIVSPSFNPEEAYVLEIEGSKGTRVLSTRKRLIITRIKD